MYTPNSPAIVQASQQSNQRFSAPVAANLTTPATAPHHGSINFTPQAAAAVKIDQGDRFDTIRFRHHGAMGFIAPTARCLTMDQAIAFRVSCAIHGVEIIALTRDGAHQAARDFAQCPECRARFSAAA